MSSKIKKIPDLKDCPYIRADINRFRIVKVSNKKYRVDYKTWWGWDKRLLEGFRRMYYPLIGFGYNTVMIHLYFENIESAHFYIRKCTRRRIIFKSFIPEIVWP